MAIKTVGVVGAGLMGAEIALCFAQSGFDVVMSDVSTEAAENGKKRQASLLEKKVSKGKLEASEKDAILARVKPTDNLKDMAGCDLVIEAVAEVFEVKSNIFQQLDSICGKDCIFASNTSSIAISKLASAVPRGRAVNVIGTHFFSPASIMELVEVVPGVLTGEQAVEDVMVALQAIAKTPVRVKDVTGFLVNRLLVAFVTEAQRCLEEGVATVEDIDLACMKGLGHPIGPFRLMDNTGHDVNLNVSKILTTAYGDRFIPSQTMRHLVDAGLLGRKTGEGFYQYDKK